MQRPAQLQRGAVPGGGQAGGAHAQAALLSGGRMGLDRRVRVVRRARAQPGPAHVLGRAAAGRRPTLSALQFRIRRLALPPAPESVFRIYELFIARVIDFFPS